MLPGIRAKVMYEVCSGINLSLPVSEKLASKETSGRDKLLLKESKEWLDICLIPAVQLASLYPHILEPTFIMLYTPYIKLRKKQQSTS